MNPVPFDCAHVAPMSCFHDSIVPATLMPAAVTATAPYGVLSDNVEISQSLGTPSLTIQRWSNAPKHQPTAVCLREAEPSTSLKVKPVVQIRLANCMTTIDAQRLTSGS